MRVTSLSLTMSLQLLLAGLHLMRIQRKGLALQIGDGVMGSMRLRSSRSGMGNASLAEHSLFPMIPCLPHLECCMGFYRMSRQEGA